MLQLSKKNQQLLLGLVIVLLWTIFVPTPIEPEQAKESQSSPTPSIVQLDSANWQTARVTRVIDGDTIEIEGGQKVRYIGIDTPETVDPRREVGCLGKEASLRNSELVSNQLIYLEKDVSETDRYGRLLRYVYLATESASVNEQLVAEGFATVVSYPPDVKYQEKFRVAEATAREAKRGLWQEDLVCD